MKRIVVIGIILGTLWLTLGRTKPHKMVSAPPPVVVSMMSEREAPQQLAVQQSHAFQVNGYELKTLAQFAVTARALSTQTYSSGREADLSPLDIAFGWGRMSEQSVIERLAISQSNRWYHWRYEGEPPIPPREIETFSANMHLIPADAAGCASTGQYTQGADGERIRLLGGSAGRGRLGLAQFIDP